MGIFDGIEPRLRELGVLAEPGVLLRERAGLRRVVLKRLLMIGHRLPQWG